MLYTKIQPQSLLSSGEELFLPYMDITPILFDGAEPFD